MGGDCCSGGGFDDSFPAQQHALNDKHLNTLPNTDKDEATSPKTHEESAKELEAFIKKRIDLFEQYAAREAAAVRQWSPVLLAVALY